MSNPSDVFVICVDGRYLVRPGACIVPPGKERVTFRNVTELDVTISFPHGTVDPDSISIPPGKSATVTVKMSKAAAFSYAASLPKIGVQAQGSSSPIFIVDR